MSNNVLKKIEKVKNYILEKRADAALLRKKSNFSWLTGGKTNRIVNESDIGNAGILVTKNGCFIVTDNIEEPRIYSEEVSDNIFNKIIFKWFEPWNQYDYIVKKVGSNNILSDTLFKDFRPMGEDFDKLKYILVFSANNYYEIFINFLKSGNWMSEIKYPLIRSCKRNSWDNTLIQ